MQKSNDFVWQHRFWGYGQTNDPYRPKLNIPLTPCTRFFFFFFFFFRFWPQLSWSWTINIIWKNILSQICSRIIFEMHTPPGACSKYALGTVCIQIMLLEHIWLKYALGTVCIQIMLLEHIWLICSWNSVHSNNAPGAYLT